MGKLAFGLVALIVAGLVSASIPPLGITTVVTTCGKPVAVYVTTHKGFAKYDNPAQVAELASKAPYNLRVESGCNR